MTKWLKNRLKDICGDQADYVHRFHNPHCQGSIRCVRQCHQARFQEQEPYNKMEWYNQAQIKNSLKIWYFARFALSLWMINLCENWLEELRFSYNTLYCLEPGEDYETSKDVEPIIINSGFRSPDTNHLCGGATHSNHLTGCAADIIRIRRRRYAMPASCWTSPTGRSRTSMSSSSRSEVRPSGYTSP